MKMKNPCIVWKFVTIFEILLEKPFVGNVAFICT